MHATFGARQSSGSNGPCESELYKVADLTPRTEAVACSQIFLYGTCGIVSLYFDPVSGHFFLSCPFCLWRGLADLDTLLGY